MHSAAAHLAISNQILVAIEALEDAESQSIVMQIADLWLLFFF